MTSFYSGMYRLFMYPNLLSEQTGEGSDGGWQYRSPYGSHEVEDGVMYYNNGFWDTYRTTWAAYSLLTPPKTLRCSTPCGALPRPGLGTALDCTGRHKQHGRHQLRRDLWRRGEEGPGF